MSLTNREIIEQVKQSLEDLRDLILFEGGTGVADFSDWLEDINDKLREADAASAMEWENEKEQDDGE
jgi:hypothetical protein